MNAEQRFTLRLPPGHDEDDFHRQLAKVSGQSVASLRSQPHHVDRQSIDARRKQAIRIQYTVLLRPRPPLVGIQGLARPMPQPKRSAARPVVVGAGPAGLFAALFLAHAGLKPLLIEQGEPVAARQEKVKKFWQSGKLDPWSNVQFGEGGAGTFSDGKLTTNLSDDRCRAVLEELVLAQAPEEILYQSRPHVGTDRLRVVVQALRGKIESLGGQIVFGCRLTDWISQQNRLQAIEVEHRSQGSVTAERIHAENLILAIGHSARDTYQKLWQRGVAMESKPFAVGVRIEHRQEVIDHIQYGKSHQELKLPPAEYKLACRLPQGKSLHTFCMCPGGSVIASASQAGGVVTNGMSFHDRAGTRANSALLVPVKDGDHDQEGVLGGMHFQRKLEMMAYQAGGGGYAAPSQTLASFLNQKTRHRAASDLRASYRPAVSDANLATLLPPFVHDSLQEGIRQFCRRMPGFDDPGAVLTAIESRSSAPLRIVRDDSMQSPLKGLFPCGEGAGYAGGIMSAAVDGLRCAQALCAALVRP